MRLPLITDLLARSFYGNSLATWLTAFTTFAVLGGALALIRLVIVRRLDPIAKRTRTAADDLLVALLRRTRFFLFVWLALEIALRVLALPKDARDIVHDAAVIALGVQIVLWLNVTITHSLKRYVAERASTDASSVTTMTALSYAVRLLVWAFAGLIILENIGYNVTTLIAGLGITGVAVALAVQNILGDLLGAISIALDKPFVIGDLIAVDNYIGSVEHIGLKTTRLRSLSGEQIIISNADLLRSRVRNYRRLYERRVQFDIRVAYGATEDQVRLVPQILRQAVEAQAQTRFDRAHFRGYTENALDFEAVYFVTSPDYNLYMDIQQAVNLIVLRRFREEGIPFASTAPSFVFRDDREAPPGGRTPAMEVKRQGDGAS
jgi:small-conductance mechanosensitive channel